MYSTIKLKGEKTKEGLYEYTFNFSSRKGFGVVAAFIGILFYLFLSNGHFEKNILQTLSVISLVLFAIWALNRFLLQITEELEVYYKALDTPNRLTGAYYMMPKNRNRYLELSREMYYVIEPDDKVTVTYGILLATVSELKVFKKEKEIVLSEAEMERKTKEDLLKSSKRI